MNDMKKNITITLFEMLQEKRLEKITVKDIADKCNISRQTFYYHFSDIFDIVKYIFSEATNKALEDYSDIDNWETGYVRIMNWTLKNKNLVLNTYNSVRREYVEYFMKKVLFEYIIKVVKTEAKNIKVTEEQCDFIANFYTLALNAVSLEWIRQGMVEKPEVLAKRVNFLIEGDFQKALYKFERENRKGSK